MVIETELSWGLYSKVGAAVSLYTFTKEYVGSKRESGGEREIGGEREMMVVGRAFAQLYQTLNFPWFSCLIREEFIPCFPWRGDIPTHCVLICGLCVRED